MLLTAAVGLLAGIGAALRHLVDALVGRVAPVGFPFGTLVVNLSGSFVLGLVSGLATGGGLDPGAAVALSAGLCGGYTTWSTYAAESLALAEGGARPAAAANLVGSVLLGLGAAALGLGLGQL